MGRVRQNQLRVTEADVQRAVVDMLAADGWRAIRTDPVSDRSRGKGFGEIGMPDYLFIRYHGAAEVCPDPQHRSPVGQTAARLMWIEFKAPDKYETPNQRQWHIKERTRGGFVLVVSGVDDFREWYKTSGLMRNTILS